MTPTKARTATASRATNATMPTYSAVDWPAWLVRLGWRRVVVATRMEQR
jgi:hypothetical protein